VEKGQKKCKKVVAVEEGLEKRVKGKGRKRRGEGEGVRNQKGI
jgi:hypothetical protein